MGANQSSGTRTVTMENDSPTGVINVSEEVVQRLKSGLAKGAAAARKETAAQTQKTISNPQPAATPVAAAVPLPAPVHVAVPMTSIDLRHQTEQQLQQNDAYWRDRLASLEQNFDKSNAVLEREYSQAFDNVRKRFANAPPTYQLPPCQKNKAQLIECLRSHPGESLKCNEEVAAFTKCVSESGFQKLDAVVEAKAA